MDFHLGGDPLPGGLHPDAAVHIVGDGGDNRHDDEGSEYPADQELDERQTEDVKADVSAELRVFHAEVHAVEEQDGLLPLPAGSSAHDEGKQDGYHHSYQPAAMANCVVIVADQLLFWPRWARGGRQTVGNSEVGVQQQEEEDDEDDRQDDLVDQDLGPDIPVAQRVEPQVVGPHSGRAPQRQNGGQQDHQNEGGDDLGPARKPRARWRARTEHFSRISHTDRRLVFGGGGFSSGLSVFLLFVALGSKSGENCVYIVAVVSTGQRGMVSRGFHWIGLN